MKRIFIILTSICTLTANAQDYLISFTGTGASTTVNSVKVDNMTKGTTLTLNGSDILHLTVLTKINSINYRQSSILKIYPNPANGNSILKISPPANGDAIISVLDMTGKLVFKVPCYLEKFSQEFRLSGLKSGFYLVSIKGNSFQYSGKLLCNSKETGTISIEKISNDQAVDENKIKTITKGEQLTTTDMNYSIGDRLKLTGSSGIYSTVVTDVPASNKTITFNFIACTDGDNNNYSVVQIGTQLWMAENLKTNKFIDGTAMPNVTDDDLWAGLTTGAYCDNNNDPSISTTYGKLYNYFAAVDPHQLCPTSWHVPSDAEWTILTTFLGGENVAGGKLKETGVTHWKSPNSVATNDFGFTALPGGIRSNSGFYSLGEDSYWWSSTEVSASSAWFRTIDYSNGMVIISSFTKIDGFSVRCIKN
jgi:uncharacterized protein (TIGR02145 family)